MVLRSVVAALLFGLAAQGAAWSADPFASLSPQDRSVARVLHAAQDRGSGMHPLSLDQIATLKAVGESWDDIFTGMRADGLIRAPDLASLIRGADPGNAAAQPAPEPKRESEPVALPAEPPAMDRPLDRPAPRPVAAAPPPRIAAPPPPRRHRYGGRDDVGAFDALGRPFTAD
jgi:hypothetical protein